ncbi:MAG: hypothetical protein MRK02_14475 [Candidatus Scalindua sp.]|nr:hypothetical protein [Candidatus Scalindua sp.]
MDFLIALLSSVVTSRDELSQDSFQPFKDRFYHSKAKEMGWDKKDLSSRRMGSIRHLKSFF